MVREERKLTNIKLTESDTDGIWLHFECDGEKLKTGIALSSLVPKGDITKRTIEAWAREQLDKQKNDHRRFHLRCPYQTVKPGTRPSPPVEGGY